MSSSSWIKQETLGSGQAALIQVEGPKFACFQMQGGRDEEDVETAMAALSGVKGGKTARFRYNR